MLTRAVFVVVSFAVSVIPAAAQYTVVDTNGTADARRQAGRQQHLDSRGSLPGRFRQFRRHRGVLCGRQLCDHAYLRFPVEGHRLGRCSHVVQAPDARRPTSHSDAVLSR